MFFLTNTKFTLESCYFSCHTEINVLSAEAFPWNSQSCNESGIWQGTETLLSALRRGRWDSLQPSEGEPTQPHVLIESDISMSAESGYWEKKIFLVAENFPNWFPAKYEKAQTWPLLGRGFAKCYCFVQAFSNDRFYVPGEGQQKSMEYSLSYWDVKCVLKSSEYGDTLEVGIK